MMRIIATMDSTGRITAFATVGGLVGGQTIDIPDDTDLSILSHARWDGEQLIKLPPDPPSSPSPTDQDRINAMLMREIALLKARQGGASA